MPKRRPERFIDEMLVRQPVPRAELYLIMNAARQIMAFQAKALAAALNKKPDECQASFDEMTVVFGQLEQLTDALIYGDASAATKPPSEVRRYRANLVGESFRQEAIRSCSVGDDVLLLPEPDNSYDPRAIAAFSNGDQIGYLPRDGWLTRVILDEEETVVASIEHIGAGGGGHLGVVLDVRW